MKTGKLSKTGKLDKKYTDKELAESFVFRTKLSDNQKKEASIELAEARKKKQEKSDSKHSMLLKLLQLKYQIEDYSKSSNYDNKHSFGFFLKTYLKNIEIRNKDFAEDISIPETYLSQVINHHRKPNDELYIKLEIHSSKVIPAITWYRLAEKEKEYEIITDTSIRKKEQKFVKNSLNFSNLIKHH